MQRLDKILSDAGVASRKDLRALIRAGRVTVNGAAVTRPEEKFDAAADAILVDGAPIRPPGPVVVMLHKPAGYVTSTDDPRDPTVLELLPEEFRNLGLFPVGRLDKETEGLLLLTNDGALSHRLTSPRRGVEKCYEAVHQGQAGPEDIAAFAAGLTLRDGTVCRPAVLEPLGPGRSRVTVSEGKYHQVRRMLAARGLPVTDLTRISEGGLTLQGLPRGQCRLLSAAERRLLEGETADYG